MKKNFLIIVLVSAAIVAVFAAVNATNSGRVSKVGEGPSSAGFKKAPDFTLSDINGKKTNLSDYKGKVVILDFWATWCPPCKAEIPHFIALYNEYREEGLEIIGVTLDHNAEEVARTFAEQNGINYTVLLGNRSVSDLYGGIMSIPTTFVIDRDGLIRKKYLGYQDKEVFEKDILELL